MIAGGPVDLEVRQQLVRHLRFIRAYLERDVGGNHLIKNLKAWIALGVFFGDSKEVAQATQLLERELGRQILPDGGHYERSAAYHVQVLGDLIDIEQLLTVSGYDGTLERITDIIQAMKDSLGVLLDPQGQLVLVNDGFPVSDQMIQALYGSVPPVQSAHLPYTGYARLVRGDWLAFVDVGDPCPDSLPAHAQADTLGCIVYYRNQRVISEAFTSTYESGSIRQQERSTAAHSTVQLAGQDSTEVWAAFRAGRRARIRDVEFHDDRNEPAAVTAWHDGYRHLPGKPWHHRKVICEQDGITVIDTVSASRPTDFVVRWHLDEPIVEQCSENLVQFGDSLSLHVDGPVDVRVVPGSQALGFGNRREIDVMEAHGQVLGTIVITTRIQRWSESGRP